MLKRTAGATLIAATLAGACASNPARSSAAVPLDVPEPPPRQPIAPVPGVVAADPEPSASEPMPAAQTDPPPTTAPSGTGAASPAPASPPPVAASPEPARPTPAPELQPAGSAGRTLTAAQVMDTLGRTKQKLDSIDRRRLNAGKSADYDAARRFLAQAADAVKANNLMLAQSSAEKAEPLAAGLR